VPLDRLALNALFAAALCACTRPATGPSPDSAGPDTAENPSPDDCGGASCGNQSPASGAPAMNTHDGGSPSTVSPLGPEHASPECARVTRAAIARQVGFVGAGMQIDLRLDTVDGVHEPGEDFATCIGLHDGATLEALPFEIAAHEAETSFTLLLVAAGATQATSDAAQTAAQALIALRPSDERIAVFRWAEDVVQLDTFVTDRERLVAQLARGLGTRTASLLPVEQALPAVQSDIAKVGGDATAALRSVVVIAPELDLGTLPAPADGDPTLVLPLAPSPDQAAHDVSERLDAERAAGFYSLGFCGTGAERDLVLDLSGHASDLVFRVKDNLDEELGGACDAGAVATGERVYADTLAITFTADERAVYDAVVAAKSADEFTGSLQLAPELAPTPMKAHLHGDTSLDCARKSFTVDLDRDRGRHLMPASSTDEYQLVMTCQDEFYIRQITTNQLLQELGLFPLRFRPIELTIDGAGSGSYLLLEKYKEELHRDFSRVRSIIRRRNDAWDYAPEVKFAATDDAASLAEYAQILPDGLAGLAGAELERVLRQRMDLDLYLEWVALMTVLENGDYVDEVVFYATETRNPETGKAQSYFTPMAWDADDIFSACHELSVNAIVDNDGLLYCVESDFDRFIFADPHLYGLYVGALERMLDFVTDERFASALQNTKDALYPLLERESVRHADVEFQDWAPGAASRDEFIAAIDAEADRLATKLRASRTGLSARVTAYRMRN
jgi:hypothetical protein